MWITSSLNLRNKNGGASPVLVNIPVSAHVLSIVNMPVTCRNMSYTKAETLFCTTFLKPYQDPCAYLHNGYSTPLHLKWRSN